VADGVDMGYPEAVIAQAAAATRRIKTDDAQVAAPPRDRDPQKLYLGPEKILFTVVNPYGKYLLASWPRSWVNFSPL
jgi:hypothetical protein